MRSWIHVLKVCSVDLQYFRTATLQKIDSNSFTLTNTRWSECSVNSKAQSRSIKGKVHFSFHFRVEMFITMRYLQYNNFCKHPQMNMIFTNLWYFRWFEQNELQWVALDLVQMSFNQSSWNFNVMDFHGAILDKFHWLNLLNNSWSLHNLFRSINTILFQTFVDVLGIKINTWQALS